MPDYGAGMTNHGLYQVVFNRFRREYFAVNIKILNFAIQTAGLLHQKQNGSPCAVCTYHQPQTSNYP